MRKNYFWVILGGITLISAIILAELVASILYLRSPERVVAGAFANAIDANSFSFNIAADDPKDSLGATLTGAIDKKQPTSPTGSADFSFVFGSQYAIKGSLTAANGQAFINLTQTDGLPPEFASALKSIWTKTAVDALYAVAEENALSLKSRLNDADLAVIFSALKKDMPIKAAGKGEDELLGNAYVVRYPVIFDKQAALAFLNDLHDLLKNQNISAEKYAAAVDALSKLTDFGGEVWVGKTDGFLRAASFPIPVGANNYLNLKISLDDYNKKVAAAPPENSSPLADILKQIYAPTLNGTAASGATAPVSSVIMPLIEPPTVPLENNAGSTLNVSANGYSSGGIMDALLRFIYGSNPFGGAKDSAAGNVFNVNTQK